MSSKKLAISVAERATHVCEASVATDTLLRRGLQVNCADSEEETPLHIAAKSGHSRFAELLLTFSSLRG